MSAKRHRRKLHELLNWLRTASIFREIRRDEFVEALEWELSIPVSPEAVQTALLMGIQLAESGKHGKGENCPTCHFLRQARAALGLSPEKKEGE